MNVQIDLIELIQQLNTKDYNELVVYLFRSANDDSHVSLMKQMWECVANADKEEFIEYLNANSKN